MADFKSVDDLGNLKTRTTSSRFSGEIKRESTLAFDDNMKCDEADTRSSERGASTRPTSVKSEISTETNLPIRNGSFEMSHDSQHMTESSCSNSLPIVRPFSNKSYQETFKEAYLLRNYGSSMDSSSSKAFDRSPEEPVTASSESGVSAQISNMAIRNAKAVNNVKISTAENHYSLMMKKGDKEISYKWHHGTTTPEDDIGEVLEQTDNLDSFNCISKTAESTRLSHGHENHPTSHFGERTKHNVSREGGKAGEVWVNEKKNLVKDENKFIAGFDLNEDINADVLDDYIKPVLETASFHRAIHVVAKAGIPIGHPTIPLKFEGGLGWKGSAQTSAFRLASPSKNSNRKTRSTDHESMDEQCFTGFDLNVAATEDKTQLEVDSKQAKSLSIDLNRLYDDASDDFTQPSFPPISQTRPWVDLNLSSDKSLADKCKNVHSSYPIKKELDFAGHDYWANFSTMQRPDNNCRTPFPAPNFLQPVEMMRREASMQPKLPFVSHTLPPQSYSYKDPFHFGVGSTPYTRYYNEHASFHTPHLGWVVHEQSTSNTGASSGKLENKNEDNLSISGSRMEDSRQFPFLARNSPVADRLHQEAWYTASLKRKEPEGGLECYRLG